MLHRRRGWFRFGLPLGIVVAAVWGVVFVIPGPDLTQPRPRAVLQNARHAAVAHQHLDDFETRTDGARRTAIATEDAGRPTRPTGELREASDQVWAEAVAGFTDLGMDLPEGYWPGMVPDITAEAAAAVVSAHGAFRARLLEVHRPFAELAREKVRILLDYGAAGSGDDASLEQARSDPETIWIASSSDGSKSVVLKRGAYPELDAAYDAFATVWNSRKAHYRSMLRAFETAPCETAPCENAR